MKNACPLLLLSLVGCVPLSQIPPNIPNGGRAVAVAVKPNAATTLVVASESGGMFRSRDGGSSWSQTSGSATFGFTDAMFLPGAPDIVIAAANSDTRVVS